MRFRHPFFRGESTLHPLRSHTVPLPLPSAHAHTLTHHSIHSNVYQSTIVSITTREKSYFYTFRKEKRDSNRYEWLRFRKGNILSISFNAYPYSFIQTVTSTYIGQNYFQHTIVIAPKSTIPKWLEWSERGSNNLHCALTFASLRGQSSKYTTTVLPHKLLMRTDQINEITYKDGSVHSKVEVEYTSTILLNQLIDDGLLLIIDEFQCIKNESNQQQACERLIKQIQKSQKSKVLLLSGTPIDQPQQIITFFRSVGILNKPLSVYNLSTREHEWHEHGLQQIVDYCRTISSSETDELLSNHLPLTSMTAFVDLSYELFQRIVKPAVSSFCDVDLEQKANIKLSRYNAYYMIRDDTNKKIIKDGIGELEKAVRYMKSGTMAPMARTFSKITKALMRIEKAKVETFIRIIEERLNEHPAEKIVVCLNYLENINTITEHLLSIDVKPLVLTGATSITGRKKIIHDFLANDVDISKNSLLVGNLQVLSTGIDLDDKFGNRPRFCLVSPNYKCLDLHQLGYRFLRQDTKSSSTVHVIYAQEDGCAEMNIIKAINRKGKIMKDTTGFQNIKEIFPNDYPEWKEIKDEEQQMEIIIEDSDCPTGSPPPPPPPPPTSPQSILSTPPRQSKPMPPPPPTPPSSTPNEKDLLRYFGYEYIEQRSWVKQHLKQSIEDVILID